LDERCYHEGWGLTEVYDDTQRARGIEIATKEPLASRRRIVFVNVWPCDGVEYCLYVVEHLGSAARHVLFGA
jgi:hypothetical protein